ncbi:DNA-binding transcriptional regulator, IclR family [Brevibacterium sandarakinum]|uniref:DNA-binding transcriptional regulator, IclR family n=1 Tax=Brevibacterium sandarakinum TaxID=629680 RepID=A0A1H1UIX0_BRESA|nr:IclR family transcriptional regulator [Brevibacterium sandarakinum]SDS72156.1 DNA-binding transcriptional regulator, IclR family [Brevibacterium sandarakinum]
MPNYDGVMERRTVAQKPAHLLSSVDNVLRLLQSLRDTGAVSITDAAADLQVSPSTAHRLLSMLVYRGFAVQDESRTYHPGPGIVANVEAQSAHRHLLQILRPHLETLSETTGETCNLLVRVGTTTRFLASEEGADRMGIGSRAGEILPARLTSGGQVLLAELSPQVLASLYTSNTARTSGEFLDAEAFVRFRRRLDLIRQTGSALNRERTERGVAALGMVVRGPEGQALAAISVSVPSNRDEALESERIRTALTVACREGAVDLRDDGAGTFRP